MNCSRKVGLAAICSAIAILGFEYLYPAYNLSRPRVCKQGQSEVFISREKIRGYTIYELRSPTNRSIEAHLEDGAGNFVGKLTFDGQNVLQSSLPWPQTGMVLCQGLANYSLQVTSPSDAIMKFQAAELMADTFDDGQTAYDPKTGEQARTMWEQGSSR